MDGVTVRPMRSGPDRRTWVTFPRLAVYPRTGSWVPPLDRDLYRVLDRRRNPFFRNGDGVPLMATDGRGRIVGRALAHVYYRHNVRHSERAAFFGYFECLNDVGAAQALIAAAGAFGAEHGCTILRGPFNMTAMQEMGLLVDGFDTAPAVDETYTAAYYPALFEASGLRPVFPVSTFRIEDLQQSRPDALLGERHRALMAEGRFRIRPANLHAFDREIEVLRELLNDSFYDNPHFVPITRDEFLFQVGPYRRFMDPAISLVAELDGVPCGFVVTVPDFNPLLKQMNGSVGLRALLTFFRGRSRIRDAVLIIMGVQRHLQDRGIMRVLLSELLRALRRLDYRRLTITWISDDNAKARSTMAAMGGRPLHRLQLYEGAIASARMSPA